MTGASSVIAAILTIARRDIIATIWSRGFLVWLMMPVVGLAFGLIAASLSSSGAPQPGVIAIIDAAGWRPRIEAARDEAQARARYAAVRAAWVRAHGDTALPDAIAALPDQAGGPVLAGLARDATALTFASTVGVTIDDDALLRADSGLPAISFVARAGPERDQAERLIERGRFDAVLLLGDDGSATLLRRSESIAPDSARRLLGSAVQTGSAAAQAALPPLAVVDRGGQEEGHTPARDNALASLATGAATLLFALISLLAGVLLSNMVEEKANKVIEVLVAAVPVHAIFLGKLLAMLFISLAGIAVWSALLGGGLALLLSEVPAGLLPEPAVGWPAMVALGTAYLVTAYLIYGGIYLGIGALCSTIREVQTLSMPVTIAQMVVLIATLGAVRQGDGVWWHAISWFPLSSPYMMTARAALEPGLGVHAAALAWQLLVALGIILLAARLFRYGVLRSGPAPSLKRLLRGAPQKSSLS